MHAKADDNTNDKIAETRDNILDVAFKHFQHFGVGKTAMADIASDVDMSTANLYRYFKNKEEIVVACSRRCLGERHKHLSSIISNRNDSAPEKLKRFFLETLKYTYEQAGTNPNITELVNVIAAKHPHIVHEKNTAEQTMIGKILLQGQQQDEFIIDDFDQTILGIHAALHLFQFPVAMNVHGLSDLEKKADYLTTILLKGLKK